MRNDEGKMINDHWGVICHLRLVISHWASMNCGMSLHKEPIKNDAAKSRSGF